MTDALTPSGGRETKLRRILWAQEARVVEFMFCEESSKTR